jgi:hypothetical protein
MPSLPPFFFLLTANYSVPYLRPGDRDYTVGKYRARDMVMVPCVAHGIPPPLITWRRISRTDYVTFDLSSRVHTLPNGSLVFNPVEEQDAGNYACWGWNVVSMKQVKVHSVILSG